MKRLLLAATSCLLIFAGALEAQPARRPVEADRIVAVVNSEAITLHELRSRLAIVERQLKGQGVELPPRDVLRRQLLERMILDRAQLQFAKETGLTVSDGELDAALRRIAENNRLSLADFRQALERDGIVWARFREEIRQEIIIGRLREREVDNRLTVSEAEIDQFLENSREEPRTETVQVAHIVLRAPEKADARQLASLRARAEEALARLERGEDFGRVAAAYSDAPDALAGGVMASRPVDRLPALYAEVVKKLMVGQTSGILQSPAGFHIVRLLDRRGGAQKTEALRQTHARHILIKVNELVSDPEANRRIVALKERIDNGADFAELARLHSNDLSAAKGGDLGWLYEGDTVPEFERAMDALKIGAVSEPVRTPFGWHLIQVLDRRTQDASEERKRLMARQALRERKSDEAYQDWLRQLRDRTYVEYRLDER